MDDLLDLNWTETKQPVIQKKKEEKPKDAFASLLPSSPRQPDISKLSLAEQQQRMRTNNSSSNQSSPWLTPLQASTPVQSLASTPQHSSTPLRTLTPSNARSSPTTSNYSTPPLQQQQKTQANSQSSPSFGDLLDPFGGKKASQDKHTPLNQLQSQSKTSFSGSENDSQWNFDLLDTSSATPVNKTSTATSVLDPFDMDSLKDTTGVSYTTNDEDNPLGILAGPAVSPKPEIPVQQEEVEEQIYIQEEPVQEEHVGNKNNRFIDEDEEDSMIAQLIDMGFSLQESKIALEATGNYDVQAAIDLLVQNAEAAQRSLPERASTASAPPLTQNERARMALFDSNGRSPSPSRRPQERQIPRETPTQRQAEQQQGQVDDQIHQQTEKIVAQAQEFGGFLYKNATSFLKTGREKVTKAVGDWQEQQRAQRLQQPTDSSRPKWMKENVDLENNTQPVQGGFVDDADSDEEGSRDLELERRKIQEMRRIQEAKQREQAAAAHKIRIQQKAKQENLIGDDVYVSPSRRRGGNSGRSTPQSRSQTPVKNSSPPLPPPQQPKKAQRTRPIINAPADVMRKVNEARNDGNDKFKLGQFGDAEIAYTRALELLPEGHDHQVLLCNNRAVCRLKNGDYKKCIQDCDTAFGMAQQSGEENIVSEGVTIQWRDQIIKSLSRKGEAFENIEKYKEALDTYNQLVKYNGTPKVNQAMARCRQALNPKKKPAVAKKQDPAPVPEKKDDLMSMFDPTMASPTSVASSPQVSAEELNKSKAVAAMRAKAAQQEADDAEKLQKTDDVNARLVAWKAGKEQNLRALLATLDSLIWPGAQWKGAQMSELINPKKCKIAYMKAIAKVHPDKLPADVTVEQKMIASGVFATLNQAWDAFKAQNPV